MPLVVLVVFCTLHNIRQTPDGATTTPAVPAAASSASGSDSNEP
jgi:hypothetical protein